MNKRKEYKTNFKKGHLLDGRMIFTPRRKVKWVLLGGDFPVPAPNKQLQGER